MADPDLRDALTQMMAQRRRVPAAAYDPQQLMAGALGQFPNSPGEIPFSGRQSSNVDVADPVGQITRTDMEHLSPGWNDFDFLHKVHGMNPAPVAEQALGAARPPKIPTNLATLLDTASGSQFPPPGSSSSFSGAVPPNWRSVGPTRPGLQLAPWNVDWSR
jgi:hypothetical protein